MNVHVARTSARPLATAISIGSGCDNPGCSWCRSVSCWLDFNDESKSLALYSALGIAVFGSEY
jgi:hypothetical protein